MNWTGIFKLANWRLQENKTKIKLQIEARGKQAFNFRSKYDVAVNVEIDESASSKLSGREAFLLLQTIRESVYLQKQYSGRLIIVTFEIFIQIHIQSSDDIVVELSIWMQFIKNAEDIIIIYLRYY